MKLTPRGAEDQKNKEKMKVLMRKSWRKWEVFISDLIDVIVKNFEMKTEVNPIKLIVYS